MKFLKLSLILACVTIYTCCVFMKAFIINLKRSSKRREFMRSQLETLDITYEFVEAVEGAALSREEIERVCHSSLFQ